MLAGLAALVAGMSARPVYRQFKSWRGRGEAREIEALLAARRPADAARKVRTAVRLAPDEPEVLRATARFLATAGSKEAIGYWQRYLAAAGARATPDERREYVEAALNGNRLDLSRPILAELLRASPTSPELLALLVRQHLLMRDLPRAAATARLLLSKDPGNRRRQLLLGTVLRESPAEPARQEGRRLLWGLVADPGDADSAAAALLAEAPDLSRSEAETVVRRLSGVTNAPLPTRLTLASVRLRFGPEKPAAVVDGVLAGVRAGEDWTATATVAEWLIRHDAARLPEWLPETVTRTNRPLLVLRAEGLAAAGRWAELKPLLDDAGSGLSAGLAHFFRGRLAQAAGRTAEAESEYRGAVESAGNEHRWLPMLARTAESQNLHSVAMAAWEHLVDDPRHAVEAARQLTRLARPLDDLTVLRRAVRRLATFFSTDDSFAAEAAVLDVLFEEDVARATQTLERLVASKPAQADWRAGLALARIRSGDPGAGLALLDEAGFDFEAASPRAKAIYVAVLGASGQRESARRLVRKIPSGNLHLQERRLTDPWL